MSKFFRAIATISLVISSLMFLIGILNLGEQEAIFVAVSGFCGVIAGLALYSVGDLLDRVNYLEDKLNMHLPVKNEDNLPQVKCKKCGKEYDMDYPRCPYCNTQTEFNN